jgi:ElaB/YqjD/DUF883 family membrane-anchored ribosome-binding protein
MVEPSSSRTPMHGINPQEIAHKLQEQGERLREQLETVDVRTRAFVQEHPLIAVGGAVFFGYVIARIASRW